MKHIRKNVTFLLLLLVACGAVFLMTYWVGSQYRSIRAAKTARPPAVPYTLESQTIAPGDDGQLRVSERRLTAVRSDGAEVWIGSIPTKAGTGSLRRMIRSNGFATTAIEAIGAKISQYLPQSTENGRSTKAEIAGVECRFPYEKSGGESTLVGIRVSVSEHQPSATQRQTVSRALDYACATIGVRFEDLMDGKWKLAAESTPIAFIGGEPAGELFDEEFYDQLKEMSPSQAQQKMYAVLGILESDCPACFNLQDLNRLDQDYYRRQSPH